MSKRVMVLLLIKKFDCLYYFWKIVISFSTYKDPYWLLYAWESFSTYRRAFIVLLRIEEFSWLFYVKKSFHALSTYKRVPMALLHMEDFLWLLYV